MLSPKLLEQHLKNKKSCIPGKMNSKGKKIADPQQIIDSYANHFESVYSERDSDIVSDASTNSTTSTLPPKVQAQKSSVGATLQSNVKLKCDVEAFPSSNNFWTKGEEMIFKSNTYTIQEKRSNFKTVMLLTIQNVSISEFDTFTCIAQNTMGRSEDSIRMYEMKLSTTTTTTTTTPARTSTIQNDLILGEF
ncbi:hypothetical protein JTB14_032335 [Gonioctena quinquepunctata]|nr:hypothetical protein JTB14_032335 [Gonioctena quinquepunctata]